MGEAFKCTFTYEENGKTTNKELVVKIMRHDAEQRVNAEAEIFTAAAKKIGPGMEKTWEGQLKQYMTEFDFTNEAKNVNEGVNLYDICNNNSHPLRAIAPNVSSMKMSNLVPPQKNVMVAEIAVGTPLDKYFKGHIAEIREAASAVFEQDAETGRIKWVDGPIDPKTNQPKTVNERAELMRVLLGAAFRDKDFVLKGFESLMSAKGRVALEKNREKAEAILEAVLDKSKGAFGFNIVYRLQAAVVELQKLGLELPPQVNCFIQSLVRLSNTVTEINTIMNQSKAMLEATQKDLKLEPPIRDELDLFGQAFDLFSSGQHNKLVKKDPTNPNSMEIPEYRKLQSDPRFGGSMNKKLNAKMFEPEGEYTQKVASRISNAEDPLAEAQRLVEIIAKNGDADHDIQFQANLDALTAGHNKFKAAFAAAKTPEEKTDAINTFALNYANLEKTLLYQMDLGFSMMDQYSLDPPNSFAGTITNMLIGNFETLRDRLSLSEQLTLGKDASNIAYNELGVGYWASFNANIVIEAIKNDAAELGNVKKSGGDKNYQIDIGV